MCRVAGRRMQEDHGLRMAGCRSRGVRSRRRHCSPRTREGRRSRHGQQAARRPRAQECSRTSSAADARRGYDRIVAAAESLVAEHGAEASLEEIARHAGVGSATLHRRFPSRQLLLEAVFKGRVEALCAKAHDLLPAPDPGPHSSPGSAPSARTPSPTGDWERPSCTAHATATHHREQPPATQ
ncbi:TetR/AcrR family transcriptional regulator [Streptomyces sp. enrichment culture]|uniref:TetR/AcrR family transcriptional regulator n=1 Tax=Streptomyces sp. enrichment culture TaxID=1795815 RepID=UPI003F565196